MEAKDGRGRDLRKAAGVRVGDVCKIEIKTRRVQNQFLGRGPYVCMVLPASLGDGKIRDPNPWASGSAQSFRVGLRSLTYDLRELASSIIFWLSLRSLIQVTYSFLGDYR